MWDKLADLIGCELANFIRGTFVTYGQQRDNKSNSIMNVAKQVQNEYGEISKMIKPFKA